VTRLCEVFYREELSHKVSVYGQFIPLYPVSSLSSETRHCLAKSLFACSLSLSLSLHRNSNAADIDYDSGYTVKPEFGLGPVRIPDERVLFIN
jgi:hypothetical protein